MCWSLESRGLPRRRTLVGVSCWAAEVGNFRCRRRMLITSGRLPAGQGRRVLTAHELPRREMTVMWGTRHDAYTLYRDATPHEMCWRLELSARFTTLEVCFNNSLHIVPIVLFKNESGVRNLVIIYSKMLNFYFFLLYKNWNWVIDFSITSLQLTTDFYSYREVCGTILNYICLTLAPLRSG